MSICGLRKYSRCATYNPKIAPAKTRLRYAQRMVINGLECIRDCRGTHPGLPLGRGCFRVAHGARLRHRAHRDRERGVAPRRDRDPLDGRIDALPGIAE